MWPSAVQVLELWVELDLDGSQGLPSSVVVVHAVSSALRICSQTPRAPAIREFPPRTFLDAFGSRLSKGSGPREFHRIDPKVDGSPSPFVVVGSLSRLPLEMSETLAAQAVLTLAGDLILSGSNLPLVRAL